MFETFRKRCSMLPFFNWFHLSIFARSLQVWCSRDFWWPCTDSQHGFHQQSGVQGASIALLALRPLWTFWADLVLKIRQGLFGGAICGRDASSHRLDYYKELPTWLFYARRKTSKKKTVLWISNQNLFEIKSIQQKTSLAYIVTNFEKCFLFLKFDSWTSSPWRIQDIHGFFHVDEAGGRLISVISRSFRQCGFILSKPPTGWTVDVAGYPTEPLQDPVDLPGFWRAPRNWEVP